MCLTKDEDISKKFFLPVVLYGRQMLFQLDMYVQNFEYLHLHDLTKTLFSAILDTWYKH